MLVDLLIINIKGLVQVRDDLSTSLSGKEMSHLPVLDNAYLAIDNGHIDSYGHMSDLPPRIAHKKKIDATSCFVLPGWVDSHTHLVFASTREEEFMMRVRGMSYSDIAVKGGGILASAKKLRLMSEQELYEAALYRVHAMMKMGTVVAEIKSGYGLTVSDEMKMLRVAQRLGRETPLKVKTTLLGAHAVPDGMSQEAYVRLVMDEMIPNVAQEGLADYIDVFCEKGFFTLEETERIVERGKAFGMQPRIHANQLHCLGGVQMAVRLGALSVDHLEHIGDKEIESLLSSQTMPTVLPWAAFFLNLPFPPVRKMIEAGLPLAIASDYNPGSSPSGNMLYMIALACIKMRMTIEEAINATTVNTASTLGVLDQYGSITSGKKASFFITKPIPSLSYIPYSFGEDVVDQVFVEGQCLKDFALQQKK